MLELLLELDLDLTLTLLSLPGFCLSRKLFTEWDLVLLLLLEAGDYLPRRYVIVLCSVFEGAPHTLFLIWI